MFSRRLLLSRTITIALAAEVTAAGLFPDAMRGLTLDALLTYGSGGTTVQAWIQTSFDGGVTWMDIACFAFATVTKRRIVTLRADQSVSIPLVPTDGTLGDDETVQGFLGPLLRVKLSSNGTYADSTALVINAQPKL